MAEPIPRRSPLEGVLAPGRSGAAPAGGPGVVVGERRGLSLVHLAARRGRARDLAAAIEAAFGLALPAPGASAEGDGIAALWTAPEQWHLVAAGREEGALFAAVAEAAGDAGAPIDLSHGRAVLRVSGARARDALAKGIALDLHPRAFADGAVGQTVVGGIGVLVHRVGEAFDLYVYSGFAIAFWEWLAGSAAEFGLEVTEPLSERSGGRSRGRRSRR